MNNFLQPLLSSSPNVEAEMLTLKKKLEEKGEECAKISAAKERMRENLQSESNTLSKKLEAKEAVCESMKAEMEEKDEMTAEADVLKQKLNALEAYNACMYE